MNDALIRSGAPDAVDAAQGGVLLDVDDLKVAFPTDRGLVRAVDGVTFTLHRGKTLGIVGESGSGKSVTSKAIMGLLPTKRQLSGSIRYEGQELTGWTAADYRSLWGSDLAMVFQDPMTSLNPVMKIGKQITESLRLNLGMDRQTAKENAIALLDAVRIPAPERRFGEYPTQLSGGMRQRVVIAVALACGPKLLFADEPTTALDVTVQAQILDLLQQQQRERFMAMVLVTHDLGVVAARADEIAVMYAGRVVEKAPTRSLFANMKMPYTQALMESIPKLNDPSHTRLAAIAGSPPDLVDPPPGCAFAPRCRYAQDRCHREVPPLVAVDGDPTHLYACFYPVGGQTVTVTPTIHVPEDTGGTHPGGAEGGDPSVPSTTSLAAASAEELFREARVAPPEPEEDGHDGG